MAEIDPELMFYFSHLAMYNYSMKENGDTACVSLVPILPTTLQSDITTKKPEKVQPLNGGAPSRPSPDKEVAVSIEADQQP
jgi:hypothetical protein